MQVDEIETVASQAPSSRYMPGLDVLRGLAILMVLPSHSYADKANEFHQVGSWPVTLLYGTSQWGYEGVLLFFVLSGLLITGILMDSKTHQDYYRGFYLRRFLRIAPAYLLLLAVLKLTHWIDWPYLGVCILYLANVCSLFHLKPEYGPIWSLSVEEQFYLTWPLAVRKLSTRALLWLSIAIVALTPILRLLLLYGPKRLSDWPHKTWAVADFSRLAPSWPLQSGLRHFLGG